MSALILLEHEFSLRKQQALVLDACLCFIESITLRVIIVLCLSVVADLGLLHRFLELILEIGLCLEAFTSLN